MTANTLGFKVKKLEIVTKTNQSIDITNIYQEIIFYDSMFSPCMSGKVVIHDSLGLTNSFNFNDGTEVLSVDMEKVDCTAKLKRNFVIYNHTNQQDINQKTTGYILHFVTKEYLDSKALTVYGTFENLYSTVVRNILTEIMQVSEEKINFIGESVGVRKLVYSGKSPISCIFDCCRKAVDADESPTFMFFENIKGYNFDSFSNISKNEPIYELTYSPNGFEETKKDSVFNIIKLDIKSKYNVLENYEAGVYGCTAHFFSPEERKFHVQPYGTSNNQNTLNEGSRPFNPAYVSPESRTISFCLGEGYFPSPASGVVKNYDNSSLNSADDSSQYIIKRSSELRAYTNMRVRAVVPGNFDLTSGIVVKLDVPVKGVTTESNLKDKQLSGKYVILAAKHIIRFNVHQTIIELSKDSTEENSLFKQSVLQDLSSSEDDYSDDPYLTSVYGEGNE